MKKYLMMGAAALVFGFAAVSCSSDDGVYNPNAQSDLIEANYNKAFINVFGQPAANQTWGFGTAAKARTTRGNNAGTVIKPDNGSDGIFIFTNDERNANGWRSPEGVAKYVAPITTAEAAWVQDWFDNHPGLSDEGVDFTNFYVQQVANNLCTEGDTKDGYFWEMKNGQKEIDNRTYHVKMDQLRIGPTRSESNTVHINDFNATHNGFNAWNAIYVKDGSSKQFAYYASYGSQWQWKFKCVALTVPGECFADGVARVGYYVGLSYYCDKVEVANQKGEIIGEDVVNYANDWILKITPGAGEIIPTEPSLRVMAEDLSASDKSDFDFNDVVFDVTRIDATSAEITLQAAGGTLPLCISREVLETIPSDYPNDDVCWEVHDLFQVDTDVMVNTKAQEKNLKGTDKPAVTNLIVSGNFPADQDGFAAAVKNIRVWVFKADKWMELKAEVGKPACKIGVPVDLHWAWERTNVNSAFNFDVWVQNPSTPLIPAQQ